MGIQVFLVLFIITLTQSFYSSSFRKCDLFKQGVSVGQVDIQRVSDYKLRKQNKFLTNIVQEPIYQDLDFIVIKFLSAGGSGEIFLVEEIQTKQRKILKRFLKEQDMLFRSQRFIHTVVGQESVWHFIDNSTMISFNDTNSKDIHNVFPQNITSAQSFIYQTCQQLKKFHKMNLIHHDIKSLNILVQDMKHAKFIDWNLGVFYYNGLQFNIFGGTPGYYPPEVLLHYSYITPAADVWSLGVTLHRFFARQMPHPTNMSNDDKDNNTQLLGQVALTGSEQFLKYVKKYRIALDKDTQDIYQRIKEDPKLFSGISLRDRVRPGRQYFFTDDLVDLLQRMLKFDPQERITMQQVMEHPYFDIVKKLPKIGLSKKLSKRRGKGKTIPADNLRVPQVQQQDRRMKKRKIKMQDL